MGHESMEKNHHTLQKLYSEAHLLKSETLKMKAPLVHEILLNITPLKRFENTITKVAFQISQDSFFF